MLKSKHHKWENRSKSLPICPLPVLSETVVSMSAQVQKEEKKQPKVRQKNK